MKSIKYFFFLLLFHQNPGDAEGSKTLCCLCCKSGPITGKHRIDRLGYVPGEAIPIMAECINHSSRDVKMTSMQLVQVGVRSIFI